MDDLRELYQATILDHNREPRNYGELPGANRSARPLSSERDTAQLREPVFSEPDAHPSAATRPLLALGAPRAPARLGPPRPSWAPAGHASSRWISIVRIVAWMQRTMWLPLAPPFYSPILRAHFVAPPSLIECMTTTTSGFQSL